MTTDHTPRLSVQHADALWTAVAPPGPATPTFTEQHERVCAAVAEIIDEVTAVGEESADRVALRDRIAEALRPWVLDSGHGAEERAAADAVQAVLPPPVSRADVYRNAADVAFALDFDELRATVANKLRRMADEAQQDGAQR